MQLTAGAVSQPLPLDTARPASLPQPGSRTLAWPPFLLPPASQSAVHGLVASVWPGKTDLLGAISPRGCYGNSPTHVSEDLQVPLRAIPHAHGVQDTPKPSCLIGGETKAVSSLFALLSFPLCVPSLLFPFSQPPSSFPFLVFSFFSETGSHSTVCMVAWNSWQSFCLRS